MKALQIINQLKATLPLYTSFFSDSFSVSSITRAGTTVTVVTTAAHGLLTNDRINVVGAISPTNIINLTFADGIASAETDVDHDLTLESFDQNITIAGADQSEYNGAHKLIDVPNRENFTFEVSGNPTTPATGSIFLQTLIPFEGYNGLKVITKIDSVTFTYEITQTPLSPAQGTTIIKSESRISGTATSDRILEAYTQLNTSKGWAFVVLGDVTASKDRKTENDATYTWTAGEEYLQRLITQFSIYVVSSAVNSIAARDVRDSMTDLARFIFKSVLGVQFDAGFSTTNQDYGVTFVNHTEFDYNGAVYMHQFNFETIENIFYDDIVEPEFTRAFRDIALTIHPFDENQDPVLADIDLDDEPL